MFNSGVRSFNRQVALNTVQLANSRNRKHAIEMGAGKAPITREILNLNIARQLILVVCDRSPNKTVFETLEVEFPGRVSPIYDPIDLLEPLVGFDGSILVLAGVMHHIPFDSRRQVLTRLLETGADVTIHEPLTRSWFSVFLAALSLFPSFLLPILFWRRPGKLRRFLWCWIVPVAPFMFCWDGIVSCLRQWTIAEWRNEFDSIHPSTEAYFHQGRHSTRIICLCNIPPRPSGRLGSKLGDRNARSPIGDRVGPSVVDQTSSSGPPK